MRTIRDAMMKTWLKARLRFLFLESLIFWKVSVSSSFWARSWIPYPSCACPWLKGVKAELICFGRLATTFSEPTTN